MCLCTYQYLLSKFRLAVHVQDAFGTTTLTLFNKESEQLVSVLLEKILAEQGRLNTIIIQHSALTNMV